MHGVALGEGERLADESAEPLADCEIPSLHVISFSAFLADRLVLLLGNHIAIRLPEVGEAKRLPVVLRDLLPESATRRFAAVTEDVAYDLPSPAAERNPEPAHAAFRAHEAPEFIQFQDVVPLGQRKRLLQGGKAPRPLPATRWRRWCARRRRRASVLACSSVPCMRQGSAAFLLACSLSAADPPGRCTRTHGSDTAARACGPCRAESHRCCRSESSAKRV